MNDERKLNWNFTDISPFLLTYSQDFYEYADILLGHIDN